MTINRYREPLFIWHIVGLVITVALTIVLTLTYMFREFAPYQSAVMIIFVVAFSISNLIAGLAIKKLGHSPWLALSGFVMGIIPLILYIALPYKSASAPQGRPIVEC